MSDEMTGTGVSSIGASGRSLGTNVLRIEGVWKSFGDLEVLKGIDLAVAEHEVVCLIGADRKSVV